ncbi:transposase [Bacillus pacificus]
MIELFVKRKKGLHIQSVRNFLQGITVYMTNIPTEWVPKEKIYDLYSLRWQIELLFKNMEILVSNSSL